MSRRLKLTVSYDGSEFHGWQVQPGLPTIQGTLQDVLSEIEGAPVRIEGSGRTDAGVHALAQVASFDLSNPIPCWNLRKAMNRLLPHAIRAVEIVEAPSPDFHARFDAIAKTYEYRIFRGEICPPFERRYVHHHPYPLDWDLFARVASLYIGEHDFTAFAASDEKDELGASKVRRIHDAAVEQDGERVRVRFRGSGFLKHMVRNLVGTMLEVARGAMSVEDVVALYESKDRASCGPTAPGSGLFLVSAEYGAGQPGGVG